MIFYLGKALMHRNSFTSLTCLCLPISYKSVGGIRQLIVQIPRIDTTLMGYWIAVQVRNMIRNVIQKNNFSIGKKSLVRSS